MMRIPMGFTLLLCSVSQLPAQIGATDPLEYSFSGGYGQVEVGGRFAGAEFHDSRPLPSRISLYYPVANSIDLSTDYWKRGDLHPMAVGTCIDGGPVHWIGREPWHYILSPHRVTFTRSDDGLAYSMRYEFGLQQAFMVFRLTVRNASSLSRRVDEYVHLKPSLRTCHTYARFDSAWVWYDSTTMASFARFDEPQTAGACVIVENAGEHPAGWAIDASRLSVTDSGTSSWRGPSSLPRLDVRKESRRPALAAFTYSKLLGPGDSLVVVLLIGTCKQNEAEAFAGIWCEKWKEDVSAFDAFILKKADHGAKLATGDPWVDRSILWSNALLAAYAHYLDGVVVPMPCPAEYNFFFTHDMLLTDLAAIAFDPERVRRDLTYLSAHARDSVIPHAYYWKDDGFKTEICPPDDWNHLWFVLTVGTYLRHTKDTAFGRSIEPLVTKSMLEALLRLQPDHLMHAQAPDWWDIGKHEGPRAYMTILIIRALREYLFMSSLWRKFSPDLRRFEDMAGAAEKALGEKLWDPRSRYLINFNGPDKDAHFYMGSLLAPVFHVLGADQSQQLVQTAERELVAPGIGVRAVMPPDFHTDSVRAFFRFAGNEAGDPYLYFNGGVWHHNNAWYVLALRATGRVNDAFGFFRSTMTLDGISRSPRGQPAMYEYRFSDPASPEYGRIDKPSYLWAAGFTLYAAYRLIGIDENEWNISFSEEFPESLDSATCSLEFLGEKRIIRKERGNGALIFVADRDTIPSLVIPLDLASTSSWVLQRGHSTVPTMTKINAILQSVRFKSKTRELKFLTSSFSGHTVLATVVAPTRPHAVTVDGKSTKDFRLHAVKDGGVETTLRFAGSNLKQSVILKF